MRILLVEDEPAARRAIERALTRRGHDLHQASTAAGAMRLLRSESYDLIMLDVMLGEATPASGLDLARAIRDDPTWRTIPVLITTGMSAETVRQKARDDALEGLRSLILEKPYTESELIAAVERVAVRR